MDKLESDTERERDLAQKERNGKQSVWKKGEGERSESVLKTEFLGGKRKTDLCQ